MLTRLATLVAISTFSGLVPAQAVNTPSTPPSPLSLTPMNGQSHLYQDALGRTYTVQPNSGGSLCDPQGCVVQVCDGGACTYYYCTVVKCTVLTMPPANSRATKQSG